MASKAAKAKDPNNNQLRTSLAEILNDNPDFGQKRVLKALKDKHPGWKLNDRLEKQVRLLLRDLKGKLEGAPPTPLGAAEMPMPPQPPAAEDKGVDDAAEDAGAGGGRGRRNNKDQSRSKQKARKGEGGPPRGSLSKQLSKAKTPELPPLAPGAFRVYPEDVVQVTNGGTAGTAVVVKVPGFVADDYEGSDDEEGAETVQEGMAMVQVGVEPSPVLSFLVLASQTMGVRGRLRCCALGLCVCVCVCFAAVPPPPPSCSG